MVLGYPNDNTSSVEGLGVVLKSYTVLAADAGCFLGPLNYTANPNTTSLALILRNNVKNKMYHVSCSCAVCPCMIS